MNIIGLDISKDYFDACLYQNKGVKHIKFDNTLQGCMQLHTWIRQHKVKKLVVAMEATGIYYRITADYFAKYYQVYVINPFKIKKYAESNFVRTKTDKTDALLIADYTFRHIDKMHSYIPVDEETDRVNHLIALQNQLKNQITQTKNRLNIAVDDYVKVVLQDLLSVMEQKVTQTERYIDSLLRKSDYKEQYICLQTITGIGNKTAAVLLQYLTSRNFKSVNQFIAFAGLSPQIKQSGTSIRGKGQLTSYGHRHLKTALYMPAVSAYRSAVFKPFVERLLEQGKPKMVIIGALMRKLAKIAYFIYKTKKPFQSEFHLT